MKKIKLSPSMMSADISALRETLAVFEKHGIDYLHIDVMDGAFVPNLMLGTEYCKKLRKMTDIPLDIHLMIMEPEAKIAWFESQPGEYVSVHVESTKDLRGAVHAIREAGAKPLAVLNPATPISAAEYILDDVDGALLMSVNPGYAGQAFIAETPDKVRSLRMQTEARGLTDFVIQVDGGVSFDNMETIIDAGADFLVIGSASAFVKGMEVEDAIVRSKGIAMAKASV